MDRETFLSRLTEIGTCDDDVQRRSMLNELREQAENLYDSNAVLTTSNADLTAKNERLREANMDLFVQIGTEKKPEDTLPPQQEPEKRKFEDLFNDKGEIR